MSNDEMTLHDLCARIPGANAATAAAARTRLDRLTKPPGSLGALEPLIVRLAAITGQIRPEFKQPAVLVVTHATPIQLILCALSGLTPALHWRWRIDLGSVTAIDVYGGGAIIRMVNEVPRL